MKKSDILKFYKILSRIKREKHLVVRFLHNFESVMIEDLSSHVIRSFDYKYDYITYDNIIRLWNDFLFEKSESVEFNNFL